MVQNKIDLVEPDQAKDNYKQIKDFLSTSSIEDPIIIRRMEGET